jgi:hypothetical protein
MSRWYAIQLARRRYRRWVRAMQTVSAAGLVVVFMLFMQL